MWRRLVTAVSVCLLAGVLAPVAAPSVSAEVLDPLPPPSNIFHGVTPVRLLETRSGAGKVTTEPNIGDG